MTIQAHLDIPEPLRCLALRARGGTEIFLLLAMTTAKSVKRFRMTTFDLVTLVQTLQRLQTTTNSVVVVLRFTLFAFSVARSSTCKSSVG